MAQSDSSHAGAEWHLGHRAKSPLTKSNSSGDDLRHHRPTLQALEFGVFNPSNLGRSHEASDRRQRDAALPE